MTGADSVTEAEGMAPQSAAPKGIAVARIAREFFGVQLHYAGVLAAKAGIPLVEAITFHTNFHRLFAYGNLSKQSADPDFLELAERVADLGDPDKRLDVLIAAYADRAPDPWPADRHPFGNHFACEAPNEAGAVRIHFRNRFNNDAHGPLHASNLEQRRADLTEMFSFAVSRWPTATAVVGQSWLYNTEGYRRLFPAAYSASRTPVLGPRPIHGLSTWGQFLDFRGRAKPAIVEAFKRDLDALDITQPWLSFPYQVLTTTAPMQAFRDEYGV
ncbi:MAG: hypothetical protein ABMA14_13210 [Hyphomonadaceae bacterium]